jgi:type IV pilus assembly protein PilA
MLTRINTAREDREAGFTLIELLVVVAIIAILAVIAIPVFGALRDNAANSAAEAEVKNAATALEVYYTQNSSYPAAATVAADAGITISENVAMDYTLAADGASYTLAGCNIDTQEKFTWDSATGSFTGASAPDTTLCVAANAGAIS